MSETDQKSETRRVDYTSILGEQEFFATPLLRKSIAEAFRIIGEPTPGATVLDIGAGECPLRAELDKAGYDYRSLDIGQNASGTIDFVSPIDVLLPENLAGTSGFDLLILTEVLEHVPNWPITFRNLAGLLKPGGHCIVTTPFFYMLHEEPHDYWRPTDHALRHFAQSNGMEVIFSRRNGDGWDVLGTLLCSMSICRREKSFLGYLATIPAWCLHRLLKVFFKSRVLQKWVDFQMRYYLGNFFVLRKMTNLAPQQSGQFLEYGSR
jgi:SAM-dependent methyltransferase